MRRIENNPRPEWSFWGERLRGPQYMRVRGGVLRYFGSLALAGWEGGPPAVTVPDERERRLTSA